MSCPWSSEPDQGFTAVPSSDAGLADEAVMLAPNLKFSSNFKTCLYCMVPFTRVLLNHKSMTLHYCLNFEHESSLPPLYWRHVLLICAAWRMLAAQWQLITVDNIRFVNSLFFTLQQQHQLDGCTELYRMLCMCVDSSTRSIATCAVFLI